jgi:integrase/recombinase XerD
LKAYLEPNEIEQLENAATNLRDRLLVRLLFHLGCRISEALALTVDDIDLTNGTITIMHLKAHVRLLCPKCSTCLGRNATFCPRCGEKIVEAVASQREPRRQRTIPIDRDTIELLRNYVERGGAVGKGGKIFIFGINRHRAWQVIVTCAQKVKLPRLVNPETGKTHNVSPHRLRDAFAVMAVKLNDSGDGLRMLQEHLGHASFNTTARYRKVASVELKEWYDKLWQKEVKPDGA